ncbi:hypothetical protein [Demequina sp. SO4-18]|uniref:hypothetical protein n=1 Tax=Demequina sp. SO4-18 TaxID=3401026 RepID=UPI003B59CD11
MNARAVGAVALVAIGATFIVAWAVSVNAVRSIEDGTAGDQLAENAFASPQVSELIADEVVASLRDEVSDPRAQAALIVLDRQIRDAVQAIASSDVVAGLMSQGGERIRDRFVAEVADPAREPGPFVLSIDVAQGVNSRLADVPVVGGALPTVSLPVLTVEAISEQAFEDVRSVYATMQFLAAWGVWIGITALAAGIGLAPRRRTFGPWALAAVGSSLVALALIAGAAGPAALASLLPGGRDGGTGILVEQVLGGDTLAPIAELLMVVGVVGVAIAALWKGVVRAAGARDTEAVEGGGPGPASAQVSAAGGGGAVDFRTTSS